MALIGTATSPSTAANSSRFLNVITVSVTITLDLPEIGVRGEAVVTGVEPCPAILPGPGKVVLTTFHHASSDLIDLYLSPQPPTGSLAAQQSAVDALLYPQVSRASVVDQAWERIGVTGNHPIWSEDRHGYVAAMDLRVGERLKNLSGDTVWVQQKLPRPGPTPVYNLEVQDEHVYYVGASGVLAHNAGKSKGKNSPASCGDENLPTVTFDSKTHPELTDNIRHAQAAGHPDVLTHGGSSPLNRRDSLQDVPNISGLSRDEYPFASSLEGGAGAWVGHVPASQQNSQGGILANFFRRNNIKRGDRYRVRTK